MRACAVAFVSEHAASGAVCVRGPSRTRRVWPEAPPLRQGEKRGEDQGRRNEGQGKSSGDEARHAYGTMFAQPEGIVAEQVQGDTTT
jgi:hypothetical protein